jgi:mycofactocin system glycosyltransferase
VRRRGRALIGGTPLRILRLTDSGSAVFERLAAGHEATTPAAKALTRRLLEAGLAHPRAEGPGPGRDTVAVVIPVRDDAVGLERLLGSGTLDDVAAIIVVDDGSSGSAVQSVAGSHRVRLLVNETSQGPGAARERGWRSASEELIAFIDADCLPDRGWLEPLLAYFDDDDVVAVAPRVSGVNGSTTSVLARFEADHGPIDRGAGSSRVGVGAVTFVPSAALIVRRASLVAVDGFDPRLRVGEDVDLVWRLLELGTVRYEPSVNVTHRARPTIVSWLGQRFRYGASAADLDRRHPGRLGAIEVNPWTAASWTLGLLAPRRWRWTGPAVAAISTGLLARRLSGAVDGPTRTAIELAGRGNVAAGRRLSEVLRREWWPVAALGALCSKRLRAPVAVAFVVHPLLHELRVRPHLGVIRATGLSLADDLAYGAGVWAGCVRRGRAGPLLPRIRRRGAG